MGARAGPALHAATPADEAIIARPWEAHARDPLWRPRFREARLDVAYPVALLQSVVHVAHVHWSPLDVEPGLSPVDVLRRAHEQRRDPVRGGPRDFCGVWRDGEWHCVPRPGGDEFFVHGPWSGLNLRHLKGNVHFQAEGGAHGV